MSSSALYFCFFQECSSRLQFWDVLIIFGYNSFLCSPPCLTNATMATAIFVKVNRTSWWWWRKSKEKGNKFMTLLNKKLPPALFIEWENEDRLWNVFLELLVCWNIAEKQKCWPNCCFLEKYDLNFQQCWQSAPLDPSKEKYKDLFLWFIPNCASDQDISNKNFYSPWSSMDSTEPLTRVAMRIIW